MEISRTWVSTCRAKWADCGCRRSSSSTPSRHGSRRRDSDQEILLAESAEMVAYPYGNRFSYGRVLDAIDVERFQFSPDHKPGLIVQYRFKNASDRTRRLRFQWSVKTDLRPGWYADRLGIRMVRMSSTGVRTRASSSPGTPSQPLDLRLGCGVFHRMRGESSHPRSDPHERPRRHGRVQSHRSQSAHTPLPR